MCSSGSEEDNNTGDRGEGLATEGHGGATQIKVGKLEHPTPNPKDLQAKKIENWSQNPKISSQIQSVASQEN